MGGVTLPHAADNTFQRLLASFYVRLLICITCIQVVAAALSELGTRILAKTLCALPVYGRQQRKIESIGYG